MFPFTLAGPEFIGFMAVLSVLLLGGAAIWIREIEARSPRAQGLLSDPYQIAYLRAGRAEAVRVAILSLIDRGIVQRTPDPDGDAKADMLALAAGAPALDHPLERRIVAQVATPTRAEALMTRELQSDAEAIVTPPLAARGLLRGPRGGPHRARLPQAAFAVISLIFALRIIQAFTSGHTALGGIFFVWGAAWFAMTLIVHGMPNPAATDALDALRRLLADLRERAAALRPGGAPNELALLAAVFGLEILPESAAPHARDLHRGTQVKSDGGGDGGSSSGCGGGGGCGGCGGCGGG